MRLHKPLVFSVTSCCLIVSILEELIIIRLISRNARHIFRHVIVKEEKK